MLCIPGNNQNSCKHYSFENIARGKWVMGLVGQSWFHGMGVWYILQEVGGTLIGENGLMVMTGAESVEWYQTWFPGVWCHSICSVPAIIMSRSPLRSPLWYIQYIIMYKILGTPALSMTDCPGEYLIPYWCQLLNTLSIIVDEGEDL